MSSDDLTAWWAILAGEDAEAAARKAKEYGSLDLQIIGNALRGMLGPGGVARELVSDEEIGIAFYALGKVARALSAISEGRRPSDDTWHDLTVYSTMVRRIRDAGQWP